MRNDSRTSLLAGLLACFALLPLTAQATTWVVDPAGGGDATTIAGAVALASPEDTLLVIAGTYAENVSTDKGLHFFADGGRVVWHAGDPSDPCLEVHDALLVDIHGFDFSNPACSAAEGGALHLSTLSADSHIFDCTFADIQVSSAGGAIYANGAALHVESCSFYSCRAAGTGSGWGGAVMLVTPWSSSSLFLGCEFTQCWVTASGGALHLEGGPAQILLCSFQTCSGTGNGSAGAIWMNADASLIQECTFTQNQAWFDGGAIALMGNNCQVMLCDFRDNYAMERGGAILSFSLSAMIVANLFAQNDAASGGAIEEVGWASAISYNTFYNNRAPNGAAVHVTAGTPVIEQNIFCYQGSGVALACATSPSVRCNDWWDNGAGNTAGIPEPSPAEGNIFLDPRFCDAGAGDFQLDQDSPCAAGADPPGCAGQIGWGGIGCANTATDPTTWGGLKAVFRPAR